MPANVFGTSPICVGLYRIFAFLAERFFQTMKSRAIGSDRLGSSEIQHLEAGAVTFACAIPIRWTNVFDEGIVALACSVAVISIDYRCKSNRRTLWNCQSRAADADRHMGHVKNRMHNTSSLVGVIARHGHLIAFAGGFRCCIGEERAVDFVISWNRSSGRSPYTELDEPTNEQRLASACL